MDTHFVVTELPPVVLHLPAVAGECEATEPAGGDGDWKCGVEPAGME